AAPLRAGRGLALGTFPPCEPSLHSRPRAVVQRYRDRSGASTSWSSDQPHAGFSPLGMGNRTALGFILGAVGVGPTLSTSAAFHTAARQLCGVSREPNPTDRSGCPPVVRGPEPFARRAGVTGALLSIGTPGAPALVKGQTEQ